MSGEWHERVVAELRVLRRSGYRNFDVAWARAVRLERPARRDCITPTDGEMKLFDETGQPELSMVDFTREACRQAWHGESPTLRHFSLSMLVPEPGDSRMNDGLGKLAA